MIPEKTHSHPCYAINFFKIPDISNDIKEVTFNTSSVYALELCNFEMDESEDDVTD